MRQKFSKKVRKYINIHFRNCLIGKKKTITSMYLNMPIYPLLSKSGLISVQLLLDACQKSYVYKLLILPNCHLTK